MNHAQPLSVTLPADVAELMQNQLAAGDYASASEVIREGLLALQERGNEVENWLRTDVAAAYDAHKADPKRARPLDEVRRSLAARFDAIERNEAE